MEGLVTLNSLRDSVEVDAECLEVLIPYLDKLLALGVDFSEVNLQQAIEGYITTSNPPVKRSLPKPVSWPTKGSDLANVTPPPWH
jgi:hypothetical protein